MKYKKIKEKSGTTIVELLVSFLIILLCMASWGKTVTLSIQLVSKAMEIQNKRILFEEMFYKNESTGSIDEENYCMQKTESGVNYQLVQTDAQGNVMVGGAVIDARFRLDTYQMQKVDGEGNLTNEFILYKVEDKY